MLKFADESWSDASTYTSIAAFGRYYFLSTPITPFVQAYAGYGAPSSGDQDESKSSGFIYGGVAGATFFIGEHFGVDMGIGYSGETMTNKADKNLKSKFSDFGMRVGIVVSL